MRNLINKLPDHDLKQHLTDYASKEQAIQFSVNNQPPFKSLPHSVNSLSIDDIHASKNVHLHNVPPPPEADPDSYKVYRAMAAKLAGMKPQSPMANLSNKKPYLILDNFSDVHSSPIVAPTPLPPIIHSHPQPSNVEIQKTIQYTFHDSPKIIVNRHHQDRTGGHQWMPHDLR